MKIAVIISVAFFVFSSSTAFSQDTIYWRSDYKLKWADFKGTPDSNSAFEAISDAGIGYVLAYDQKGFEAKVTCFFVKNKSWSKTSDHNLLLSHEQGHFDISEIHARKLRKAFSEYKFNFQTAGQDLQKIFISILKDRDIMNLAYDRETNFARNQKRQSDWLLKIKSQLTYFKEYERK